MDTSQIIMGSFAIAAAIAMVLGMAVTVHWGRNRENGLLPYFFYPCLLFGAIFVLASNRDLSIDVELLKTVVTEVKNPVSVAVGRFASVFVLFAFTERVLHRIFSKLPQPTIPKLLLTGLTVFFLTNVISPALFGAHKTFSHEFFYSYAACVGATMMTVKETQTSVQVIRNGLYFFLLAGLIMIAVKPTLVMNFNYVGLIPFLRVRLAGLTAHANALGVLTVISLLSTWHSPFKNRLINSSAWLIGLTNLILAQSKTCWIAFALCAVCIHYYRSRHLFKQYFLNYRRPHFSILIIGGTLIFVTVTGIAVMFFGDTQSVDVLLNSREGSELASFTGRDIIWKIALEEWHKYPIFGYGLPLWDEDFRRSIQLPNATSAHSQWLQSLSEAGAIGGAGLIFYLSTLFYYAVAGAKESQGFTLAIFILMISGCISETPFIMENFGASPVFCHCLLLIMLTSAYQSKRNKALAQQPVQSPGAANSGNMIGAAGLAHH